MGMSLLKGAEQQQSKKRTTGTCDMLQPSCAKLLLTFNQTMASGVDESGREVDSLDQLEAQSEVVRARIKELTAADPRDEASLSSALAEVAELTRKKREILVSRGSLSVGARAFMKHAHRGTEGFWNRRLGHSFVGGDSVKNDSAQAVLEDILSDAVWGNLHSLPGGLLTFEIRIPQGYGARWTIGKDNDLQFRGLLEPQMNDGHDKHWRHDLRTD